MKPTPQQGLALGIILLALVAACDPLTSGAGSYPTPVRDYRLDTAADLRSVVPADRALAPVVGGIEVMPRDPFTGKILNPQTGDELPPTPPLAPPQLPALPLPAEK
jgi:hypothetical protein